MYYLYLLLGCFLPTKYTVEGFDGSVWSNRFVGFVIGIVVYSILTSWFFNQNITWKVGVQLLLRVWNISSSTILKLW